MTDIPLLKVSGTHAEVGFQIGRARGESIRASLTEARDATPPGLRWDDLRRAAQPYIQATRAGLPWVADEIDACADGAGVDRIDLWVTGVEEIWRTPPTAPGKCSDFAAGPPVTFDGGIWLGHNNDLSPRAEAELVAIEWNVPGAPRLFSVGLGPFISVGFNDAGLSLTGNEVRPNDEVVGVPRLLIVRDILAQRTSAAAVRSALRPDRASSYNNLIAHLDGTIVNVEGSGTDHALVPAEDGWTVHTNHYVAETMRRHERDPEHVRRSAIRLERARHLMRTRPGPVTPAMLRAFISDHANAPDSLCRHSGPSQTVFWCVIGLSLGQIEYGRGHPCDSASQRFAFGDSFR